MPSMEVMPPARRRRLLELDVACLCLGILVVTAMPARAAAPVGGAHGARVSAESPSPALTPSPTPSPMPSSIPSPSATPLVRPAPAAPPLAQVPLGATPAAAPASAPVALPVPANRLIGPGLDVPVTLYTDCTAGTPLPRSSVALDTCMLPGHSAAYADDYFLGHNPGQFSPLVNDPAGTVLTYFDSQGVAHRFAIAGHVDVPGGTAPLPPPRTVAQFQTCLVPSGATIRVFYATAV